MLRKKTFSLIEILIVVTIIGILLGIMFAAFNRVGDTQRKAETKTTILTIDSALTKYYEINHEYLWEGVGSEVNLSDHNDPVVTEGLIKLLKLTTFPTNDKGVVEDGWGNPIYYIHHNNYEKSSVTASIPTIGETVYYNTQEYQLVSGGLDGSKTSLGEAVDNVANYPKK